MSFNWPANDSPIWPIVRVTLRTLVLLFCLSCTYNYFDERDVRTIAICIFADAGLTVLAHRPGASSGSSSEEK